MIPFRQKLLSKKTHPSGEIVVQYLAKIKLNDNTEYQENAI